MVRVFTSSSSSSACCQSSKAADFGLLLCDLDQLAACILWCCDAGSRLLKVATLEVMVIERERKVQELRNSSHVTAATPRHTSFHTSLDALNALFTFHALSILATLSTLNALPSVNALQQLYRFPRGPFFYLRAVFFWKASRE